MRGVNTNPNALAKCLAASEPNFAVLPFTVTILVFLQRGNFLSRRFHKNVTYRFVYAARCIYAGVHLLQRNIRCYENALLSEPLKLLRI